MKYYSSNKKAPETSLKTALLRGLAPDGGLYMPESIPTCDGDFFDRLPSMHYREVAYALAKKFFGEDLPDGALATIVDKAVTFDAPTVQFSEQIYSLELFHGPTLSFKDFGISFMAQLVAYFIRNESNPLHILAATSGDTGSAVGQAFLHLPGIHVWILYPKGQVSHIQEQQLTTIGDNVIALEVEGTFDDAQALVKTAFNDSDLREKINLSSANSINIGRLIPQIFYYFYSYGQLKLPRGAPALFSVPSGNFGNATAGLFAKKMGLPIEKIIGATNINDSVPSYLETGIFTPRESLRTISNAMDVGNPSNFARILHLYNHNRKAMAEDLYGCRFSDGDTKKAVTEIAEKYHYIADPHGAIGYLGLKKYQKEVASTPGVFLETAHPAKFYDIVEPLIPTRLDLPTELQKVLDKEKRSISLKNDYLELKNLLLDRN